MIVEEFPYCCAAAVLCQFGGGHDYQTEAWTKQAVVDWLVQTLSELKYDNGLSVVFAVVTTTQPNAIAALEEVGFYGYNDEGASNEHSDGHNIFPFFMPLNEWNERKFKKRYNPKNDMYKNKPSTNTRLTYRDKDKIQLRPW